MSRLKAILSDIKIQHTVFALPFAIMSAFMAADGLPSWETLLLIILSLVFARSAAMAFNRLIDEKFDRENERTSQRALPKGDVQKSDYIWFTLANSAGFIAVCWFINPLALKLSPIALSIVFFYSYTKRFTAYSHFFLGLALSLAPLGAWVAVREDFSIQPALLSIAVIFWLAGLDTIYSCQDIDFDRETGLNSIPQKFGVKKALTMAASFHAVMVVTLLALAVLSQLSWLFTIGVIFTAGMLLYEHSLVKPDDMTKVNVAFFNVNGAISVGLMAFTIADTLVKF